MNALANVGSMEHRLAIGRQKLQEAETIQAVVSVIDQAEALENVARIIHLDEEAQIEIAEHRMWAIRKAGAMLAELERGVNQYDLGARPPVDKQSEYAEALHDANLTRQKATS